MLVIEASMIMLYNVVTSLFNESIHFYLLTYTVVLSECYLSDCVINCELSFAVFLIIIVSFYENHRILSINLYLPININYYDKLKITARVHDVMFYCKITLSVLGELFMTI